MTLGEFKAWFEGYVEGIGAAVPNEAQWERIRTVVYRLGAAERAADVKSYCGSLTPGRWVGSLGQNDSHIPVKNPT